MKMNIKPLIELDTANKIMIVIGEAPVNTLTDLKNI